MWKSQSLSNPSVRSGARGIQAIRQQRRRGPGIGKSRLRIPAAGNVMRKPDVASPTVAAAPSVRTPTGNKGPTESAYGGGNGGGSGGGNGDGNGGKTRAVTSPSPTSPSGRRSSAPSTPVFRLSTQHRQEMSDKSSSPDVSGVGRLSVRPASAHPRSSSRPPSKRHPYHHQHAATPSSSRPSTASGAQQHSDSWPSSPSRGGCPTDTTDVRSATSPYPHHAHPCSDSAAASPSTHGDRPSNQVPHTPSESTKPASPGGETDMYNAADRSASPYDIVLTRDGAAKYAALSSAHHVHHPAASRAAARTFARIERRRKLKGRQIPSHLQEVHYSASTLLRQRRSALIKRRKAIQDFAEVRYKTTRELMKELDMDQDGIISEADFVSGLVRLGFPITEPEAAELFVAIDRDGNKALDYREMVSVLAPATLTSIPSRDLYHDLTDHSNFNTFTKVQLDELRRRQELDLLPASDSRPSTSASDPRHRKVLQAEMNRRLAEARMSPPSDAEVHAVRAKLVSQIASRGSSASSSTMKRVTEMMSRFGMGESGYMPGGRIVEMLSQGFGVSLEPREFDVVRLMCTDDAGACEPRFLAKFLSEEPPPPDLADDPKLRTIRLLEASIQRHEQEKSHFEATLPPSLDAPTPRVNANLSGSSFKPTENTVRLVTPDGSQTGFVAHSPATSVAASNPFLQSSQGGASVGSETMSQRYHFRKSHRPTSALSRSHAPSASVPSFAVTRKTEAFEQKDLMFSPSRRSGWCATSSKPVVSAPSSAIAPGRARPQSSPGKRKGPLVPSPLVSASASPIAASAGSFAERKRLDNTMQLTVAAGSARQPLHPSLISQLTHTASNPFAETRKTVGSGHYPSHTTVASPSHDPAVDKAAMNVTGLPQRSRGLFSPVHQATSVSAVISPPPSSKAACYGAPTETLVRKGIHGGPQEVGSQHTAEKASKLQAKKTSLARARARVERAYEREDAIAKDKDRRAVLGRARTQLASTKRLVACDPFLTAYAT